MSPRFSNPPDSPPRGGTPRDFAAFFLRRAAQHFSPPKLREGHVLARKDALAQLNDSRDQDTVTWLGHAAFYIRLNGAGFLTDPYLSEFAGPFIFGPRRFARAEIGLDDLPPIDAVLITHNHYDHLDATTLRKVARKSNATAIVPAGLGALLRQLGFDKPIELNWHEAHPVRETTLRSAPAIHWSKRGLLDENRSHWCGYLIESPERRIYFTGDTAYGPVFKTLGAQWGEIDLGIVPIGAYEPKSIMESVHTTPEEAVQIARDTHCKAIVPMHWGTVILTDEDPWEPEARFRSAAAAAGYGDTQTRSLSLGATIRLAEL